MGGGREATSPKFDFFVLGNAVPSSSLMLDTIPRYVVNLYYASRAELRQDNSQREATS